MTARVLVVEDDEDLTILLRYNLEREGHFVETLSRGDVANSVILDRAPNLLLLDWGLPGMSGVELCRQVRQRNEMATIPIIMVTGLTTREHEQRALDCGVNVFFRKPFSLACLIAAVRQFLKPTGAIQQTPSLQPL